MQSHSGGRWLKLDELGFYSRGPFVQLGPISMCATPDMAYCISTLSSLTIGQLSSQLKLTFLSSPLKPFILLQIGWKQQLTDRQTDRLAGWKANELAVEVWEAAHGYVFRILEARIRRPSVDISGKPWGLNIQWEFCNTICVHPSRPMALVDAEVDCSWLVETLSLSLSFLLAHTNLFAPQGCRGHLIFINGVVVVLNLDRQTSYPLKIHLLDNKKKSQIL